MPGYIFSILDDNTTILSGLTKNDTTNQYRIYDVSTLRLIPKDSISTTNTNTTIDSCLATYSQQRPSVLLFTCGRLFLFRFSFDRAPELLVRYEQVNWDHPLPTWVSFMNYAQGWTFCAIVGKEVGTFVLKENEHSRQGDNVSVSVLNLKVGPLAQAPSEVHFIAATTTCLVVSPSGSITSYANGTEVEVLSLQEPVRMWAIGDNQWITSSGVGTLSLVSVALDGTQLEAVQLCVGPSRPSTVSLVHTATYKQGVMHLVFIGYGSGHSSLSAIVGTNPPGKRVTHMRVNLNLAPIRSLDKVGDRLLIAYGNGGASGVAVLSKRVGFAKLIQWSQRVEMAWCFGSEALALESDKYVRLLQVSNGSEVRELRHAFSLGEEERVLTVALLNNVYICVTTASIRCVKNGTGPTSETKFGFQEPALFAFSNATHDCIWVVMSDGSLKRFVIDPEANVQLSQQQHHTVPIPHLPQGVSCPQSIGSEEGFFCVSNGQLLCLRGDQWAPVTISGLALGQERVVQVCYHASNSPLLVTVCVLVQSQQQYHQQQQQFSCLVFMFSVQTLTAAPSVRTQLPPVHIASSLHILLRFVRRNLVSLRLAPGFSYALVNFDLGGGGYVCYPVVDDWTILAASSTLFVLQNPKDGSLGLASHHQGVHDLASFYQSPCTVTHVGHIGDDLVMVGDVDGTVQVLQGWQRPARSVASYCFPTSTLLSDLQRVVTTQDMELLAVATCQSAAQQQSGATAAADDGRRLIFTDRRVVFLRLVRQDAQLQQATSHHPIEWPGVGGCRLLVRGMMPLHKDRVVVVADTIVAVYQYSPQSPSPTCLCFVDLAHVSGNDIVSSMHIYHNLVTLSHVFGSVAVLNFHPNGTFTLHCKGSAAHDGVSAMLSRDIAAVADSADGLLLYGRSGTLLKPLWPLALDGVASAMFVHEESNTIFVGTNTGAVFGLRKPADWKALETAHQELQGGAGSASKDAPVSIIDGDRIRLDVLTLSEQRRRRVSVPGKALLEGLTWLN